MRPPSQTSPSKSPVKGPHIVLKSLRLFEKSYFEANDAKLNFYIMSKGNKNPSSHQICSLNDICPGIKRTCQLKAERRQKTEGDAD